MAKRGRKRKNGPRMPSGKRNWRRVRAENLKPTSELLIKKIARLRNAGCLEPERNLGLAESWLGVVYASGVIDCDQYQAGLRYYAMYRTLYPQGWPVSAQNTEGVDSQPFEPANDDEELELAFKAAKNLLIQLDKGLDASGMGTARRIVDVVENICVFDRHYRFIDTRRNRPESARRADMMDRTCFVGGLEALAKLFGFKASPPPYASDVGERVAA